MTMTVNNILQRDDRTSGGVLQKLSTITLRTRYSELEYVAVHVYVPTSASVRPVITRPKLLLEVNVVVTCAPVVLQQ